MVLSKTFAILSDANRQKIIDLLKKKEMTVSDILENFDFTMATLSHHLEVLRKADLISGRRQGKQIFYSLNLSVLDEVAEKIAKFLKHKR